MEKQCSKCGEVKILDLFNIARNSGFKFGRTPWCKMCAKAYTKDYTLRNKEARLQYNKQYKQKNKEALSDYNRKYLKKYYECNKDKILEVTNAYTKSRCQKDPLFRLARNLRRRLHNALKGKSKSKKTLDLLGCSIDDLKNHIEAKFRDGMDWNNYGSVWHIDHIKPLALFDLSNDSDISAACNYVNLQPLIAKENLKKFKN